MREMVAENQVGTEMMPLRTPNLGHPWEEHRLGLSREVYGESELFMSLVCEVRIWLEIRLEMPRGRSC